MSSLSPISWWEQMIINWKYWQPPLSHEMLAPFSDHTQGFPWRFKARMKCAMCLQRTGPGQLCASVGRKVLPSSRIPETRRTVNASSCVGSCEGPPLTQAALLLKPVVKFSSNSGCRIGPRGVSWKASSWWQTPAKLRCFCLFFTLFAWLPQCKLNWVLLSLTSLLATPTFYLTFSTCSPM